MSSADDQFYCMELLLKITGLGVHPEERNRFFTALTFFTFSTFLYDIFAVGMYQMEDHATEDRIANLQLCVSLTHLITKSFNLRLRSQLMLKIIQRGKSLWAEMSSNEKNTEILKEISASRVKGQIYLLLLYFSPGLIPVVSSLSHNLIEERAMWRPLFCVWNPLPPILGEDWYWSTWTTDFIVMGYALVIFLVVNTPLYVSSVVAKAQMKVLIRMLQSDEINVRECAKLHQAIVMYVMDVKKMFSGQMAVEILCSALQISPRGFLLLSGIKNNDPRTIETLCFFLACIGTPILICYCGHTVTTMSELVFTYSYQNKWYNLSLPDQKILYTMMLQASKLLELQYAHMIAFNMEQLARVLQGTYSYMTLLSRAI